MSFASYKKAIEAQEKRERRYCPESYKSNDNIRQARKTEHGYAESRPRKRHTTLLVFLILIGVLFSVAAIKNPSENEGKEMVKSFVVEIVNDNIRNEMTNNGLNEFEAFLGITLSPHMIDWIADTNVNDYILFSTFDCTAEAEDGSTKTVVSGIILFGKIIPLKTDLKPEALEMADK